MKMKMTNLPGVGKKLSFVNSENQMMAMIIHHSGKRELYFFEDEDDDEAVFTFNLSSEETKQLGTQFLSATLDPEMNEKLERLQLVRKQVIVEWIDVTSQKRINGKTFSEVEKLLPAGVAIVGIFHDEELDVSPKGDTILQKGNTIMVVGKRPAVEEFLQLCESEDN